MSRLAMMFVSLAMLAPSVVHAKMGPTLREERAIVRSNFRSAKAVSAPSSKDLRGFNKLTIVKPTSPDNGVKAYFNFGKGVVYYVSESIAGPTWTKAPLPRF